jgi:mannose/cellobiose epimerase-like protein (N-acyl-D-glucosamine 2-epimerase family)
MKPYRHLGVAALVCAGMAVLVGDAPARLAAQVTQPSGGAPATLRPKSRLPLAEIQKQVDRRWVQEAATTGLLDYWVRHSVEPNGFIQENLDRQWKPWGTQREASVNGQGRQLYSMAAGYEMTRSKEYLDALSRGMDFLMKMRDEEFGGYYNRVRPDLSVIDDTKAGFQSFALYSLAIAGRVTGERKYLDAAMVLFREVRDKMRDGPFIGSGSFSRDFMLPRARGGGPGGRGGGGGRAGGAPGGAGQPGAGAAAVVQGQPAAPAAPGAPGAGRGGGAAGAATHRINLHMFEALLSLFEATKSEEVWYEIAQELKAIERLFDHEIGYLPESYDASWRPVGNPSGNPGHLFEWASLLSRAVELGADPKFIELGSRNLDLGLKSYNHEIGGLGGINAAGQPTRMLWWPQCEVIKATANYAILHGRTDLWPIYHKTLEFVKKEYFDTEHGGWFPDFVLGQPRAERAPNSYYKGSVDGPEWGAYHQISMYEDLWRITSPDFQFWPTRN